jgi:hypothetical protein
VELLAAFVPNTKCRGDGDTVAGFAVDYLRRIDSDFYSLIFGILRFGHCAHCSYVHGV